MKLLVSANNQKHLIELLKTNVAGILLYLNKLSVNSNYYININDLEKIDFQNKEVFIVINKLMHNSDLPYLTATLKKIQNKKVKILFYDMSVYNIAKELNMVDQLIIYQDHLNASIQSHKFYYKLGITGSYVTSDITAEELLAIKNNTKMTIMFTAYGYLPIFYSRRYLITNYLKYINQTPGNNYHIINDEGISYPIDEEDFGTTVYTKEPINLINYLDELSKIDYLVLNSNMIPSKEFNEIVEKFLRKESMSNCYLGFFHTKTIYKVK